MIGRLRFRTAGAAGATGGDSSADDTAPGDLPLVDRVRDELVDRAVLRPSPGDIAGVVGALGSPDVEQVRVLAREFSGLGDLAIPFGDPEVTDVLVNGPGPVWVDRGRGVEPTELCVPDEPACRALAVRLATACGVRLDDARPYADGVLTDLPPGVAAAGVRVHAVLAPPAGSGTCVSLRALSRAYRDVGTLQQAGMFPADGARLLCELVAARRSFLVSGGTGSGKTTLLGALLGRVAAHERLLLVEDTPELLPEHPHVVRLHTREAGQDGSGGVDMRTLVRQSLRMRPDRIIVGEIRGAEIAELLLAFNTGHRGSAGTLHANSLSAVPGRLTALGALAGMPAESVARQVVDGVDTVVHLQRRDGRRQLAQIGRLTGSDGVLRVDPVWEQSW